MFTRRFVIGSALSVSAFPAFDAAKLGDDGLYHQDWSADTFLELPDYLD